MERKWTLVVIISIGLAVLAYYYIQPWSGGASTLTETSTYEMPPGDTVFGGYFSSPYINDSLPHYEYKRIEDSFQRQKTKRDMITQGTFSSGLNYGFLGVARIENAVLRSQSDRLVDSAIENYVDSIHIMSARILQTSNQDSIRYYRQKNKGYADKMNMLEEEKNEHAHKKKDGYDYYFGLKGYSLDHDAHFYIHNGKNYLLYPVKDSLEEREHLKHWKGHYESTPLTMRYASTHQQILFPVSVTTYQVLNVVLNVLSFLMLLAAIYFCLVLPVHIVWNISVGKVFDPYNYRKLKLIGLVLFISTLIAGFAPYIIRWFLGDLVPAQFKMEPLFGRLMGDIPSYFLAVFVFAIGIAFQRGAALQLQKEAENDNE